MSNSHDHSTRFGRTRDDHDLETAADYCELVEDLIVEQGQARNVDLARRLGIHPVTVGKTVKRLAREGFLQAEPYRPLLLTKKGAELARASREKHNLVLGLLLKLGVDPEVAEIDSEGMEHHASMETLEAIRKFLDRQ